MRGPTRPAGSGAASVRGSGLALAACMALGACIGVIGDRGASPGDPAGVPDGGVLTPRCEGVAPQAGPAPIRRLSRAEYLNSVRDLFPRVQIPSLPISADARIGGFDNNALSQGISPAVVEQYETSADLIADAIGTNVDTILPCQATNADQELSCGRTFIATFGRRAYRRPLTADETARFERFFTDARTEYGFATAIGMLVRGVLRSPYFLYRPEFGSHGTAAAGDVQLTPHELAARLSYFLWQSLPDSALDAAADSGQLATNEQIEAQVTRMLADPRARASVAEFHRQWLNLDRLESASRDPEMYPGFDDSTRTALRESTARFVDHVFWDGEHTVRALLTDRTAFVNDAIAPLYGVTAPQGATLARVDLDPQQRAGILTQAGLLTILAHPNSSAPVRRGVFVLDRLLCSPPPPPPPDVNNAQPSSDGTMPRTTRERYAAHTSNTACSGCHASIDGIGFGLEHYDAVGRYRTTESGLPIDASGEIRATRDADGTFNGGVELAERLGNSQQVVSCVSTHWLRFGMGRTETNADACAIQQIAMASGGDLRALLVRLATSHSFRYRPALAR